MEGSSKIYLPPTRCEVSRPSANVSLVDLYGLRNFANSVARQDPTTGAKRKLRKSYKNHIGDLPGRHPIPNSDESKWNLTPAAFQPASASDSLRSLDIPDSMIEHLKIIPGPLPNFDTSLLAAPSPPSTESKSSFNDEKRDKRKRREGSIGPVPDKRRKT
ncbi:hypothetical protein DASB73_039370 [Starmerella bacillaris]|uniref:Mediator of RNA polymerase II transcription subunit 19 n=1 Tax=Starmerella bacillaris TaxID=1247836 RepID=A0AAV5RN77_STABA|nr:hypothetical protein DASB73_039370 [Starmerella bacillaris]